MRSRKLSCPYLSAYKQVLEQIQGLNYEGLGCHTQRVPPPLSPMSAVRRPRGVGETAKGAAVHVSQLPGPLTDLFQAHHTVKSK